MCADKCMFIHNITSSHASFEKFLSHDPMVVMILVIKDAISRISMDKKFSGYNLARVNLVSHTMSQPLHFELQNVLHRKSLL